MVSYLKKMGAAVIFLLVTISTNIHSLTIHATCDNFMKVYCDGVEQTGQPNVDNWPLSDEFHVDDNTRVIGIECTDAGVIAGIMASISDGTITDSSWSCSLTNSSGWAETGFVEDVNWNAANTFGTNAAPGISNWNPVTGIDDSAHWIWTNQSDINLTMYCRKQLRGSCPECEICPTGEPCECNSLSYEVERATNSCSVASASVENVTSEYAHIIAEAADFASSYINVSKEVAKNKRDDINVYEHLIVAAELLAVSELQSCYAGGKAAAMMKLKQIGKAMFKVSTKGRAVASVSIQLQQHAYAIAKAIARADSVAKSIAQAQVLAIAEADAAVTASVIVNCTGVYNHTSLSVDANVLVLAGAGIAIDTMIDVGAEVMVNVGAYQDLRKHLTAKSKAHAKERTKLKIMTNALVSALAQCRYILDEDPNIFFDLGIDITKLPNIV